MKKILKKILSMALGVVAFLCCVGLFGCANSNNNERKKYDVTIKIKNSLGDEWIFTPNISELSCEYEYTGEEITFKVDSYNLADHPILGDSWSEPHRSGPNVFSGDILYKSPSGDYEVLYHTIKEKGEYDINYCARATSDLWNYRSIHLFVTIK